MTFAHHPTYLSVSLLAALTTFASASTTLDSPPVWDIPPGERAYITTGSTERSVAYNPTNDHLLLASRAGGTKLVVLDASDGSELRLLDTSGLSGGTFAINHVGVDAAGVIYACNLTIPSTTVTPTPALAFKLYRWESDVAGTASTVAFAGDPSGLNGTNSLSPQRWGDTMAVRGSGVNTQIIIGTASITTPSASGVAFAVFTTTDGTTFTPKFFPSGMESGGCKGITFGEGDTFYSKASGAAKKVRRSSFNLTTGAAATLNDFTIAGDQLVPLGSFFSNDAKYLATIELNGASASSATNNPEIVRLYDISTPSAPPAILDTEGLSSNNLNANLVGSVAIGGGRVYSCATNDGLQAFHITVTPDVVAPGISGSPAARSALERGQTTFSVAATGTPPLTYQWYQDDAPLNGATLPSLLLNPILPTSAGAYKCRVTNSGGFADSIPATLTVLPSANSAVLNPLWQLAPGSRAYLQNDDTQRGLDYHPTTQRLYVVSRTPAPAIRILDAMTGADLGVLDLTGVSGGNFPINMVGVADDGVIYACNLSNVTDGSSFKVYRWADDQPTTQPTVIYDGNPFDVDGAGPLLGARLGDDMDVRGAGVTTQIMLGARSVNKLALLLTQDTTTFTLTAITATGAANSAFGLGIAFGEGPTVWGKALGSGLTYMSFDSGDATATLLKVFSTANFPSSIGPIAVDLASQSLMGVSVENSDNVQIFELPVPYPAVSPTTLTLLDQEFFPTDNLNNNGTGAVVVKSGKAYAINTFNGIVAYTVTKAQAVQAEIKEVAYDSGTGQISFKLYGELNATYQIQRSPDLSQGSWTADGTETLSVQGLPVIRTATAVNGKIFFRAVKQ